MKKKTPYILTGQMARDLCAETPRERLSHRLHCVALVLHGSSASEVARIFGDSPRAVAYWVKWFQSRGIDGLKEESRSGRPSKLNATQAKDVQQFISCSKRLKAETLSEHIEKTYGISLTVRQCSRILKRSKT